MASEKIKDVISPHAEGQARLTFSPDGRFLYTGGYEGYIRKFDARTEGEAADPVIIDYHQDAVVSLAATNDFICSASESGQVVLHQAGTTEFEGFLTRFSCPARSVRFDAKGKRAVVTSDEIIAKVIDVKDTAKVQILTGHSRSIREASWSPDGHFVTTSSVDGSIRVWQLDSGTEPTCVQVIDGLITAEEAYSEHSVEVIWHPSSKFFVVAGKDNDIAVVSRETWQKTGSFSAKDGHSSRVSALAFSVNGLYLASAAGTDGDILIWSVKDRSIVARTPQNHGLITSLAFHPAPTANCLAYIDNKGQLTRWNGAVPSNLPAPTFSRPTAASTSTLKKDAQPTTRRRSDSASTSTSSHAGGRLFRKDRDGEEDDEYGNLDDLDFDGVDGLDGWIDDDLNDGGLGVDGLDGAMEDDPFGEDITGAKLDRPTRETSLFGDVAAGVSRRGRDRESGAGYTSTSMVLKGQPAFQPGATPWREKRRYLAFNMVGYIFAVEREEGQSVTVEFHDRSAHIPQKFDDPMKYNLGALGELGAIFSCPSIDEHPSQLFYKPYESWTSLQTWTASLPAGEDATVLAIGGMGPPPGSVGVDDPSIGLTGSGTILVATSRGFVRFFSGAGLQKYVWNVGEEVVTMAAGKDWAMIVHRSNGAGAGLEYALIDTDTFEVVQQGRVPLSGKTTLRWIGFTDDNVPVIYDSTGLISILDRSRRPRQGRWLPALDTASLARREGKQESYWPVGVTDQQAHVVILKGGETHPHFPTPLLQELDLQFPLLNLDVPQGQLEEKYLRENLFVSHRKDGAPADDFGLKSALAREELAADKHLLQIIQTFCKADRLEAALDAVLLLTQSASLNAAVKIAAFFDLPALKERIELIQQAKEDEADPDAAAAKRQSKWAHLSDERYITSAPIGNGGFGTSRGAANLFAPGVAAASGDMFSQRPSGSSAFGSARKFAATPQSVASSSSKKRKSFGVEQTPLQQQQPMSDSYETAQEDDEIMYEGDEQDEAPASSPKRSRVDSEEVLEEEAEEAAPPPKKALNPFAKRAAPPKTAASPAANPFLNKKASKTRDLAPSKSFFGRVEGKEPPKPKGKGTKASSAAPATSKATTTAPGSRQTTLFGMAPPAEKEKPEKKSKKRKSIAGEELEEPTEPGRTSDVSDKTRSKLDAFRKKPGSQATSGLGSEAARELPRDGEEVEETRFVDETQEDTQLFSGERQRRPSELEVLTVEQDDEAEQEVEETQGEDTQMDETQVEETQVEETPFEEARVVEEEDSTSLKENTRPPSADAPSAAVSKLAQFAFKKPEAVAAVEEEVASS
ncbi:hypothetical protein JCM11251_002486 [Rhodosporidiobolus azoricus]